MFHHWFAAYIPFKFSDLHQKSCPYFVRPLCICVELSHDREESLRTHETTDLIE